MIGCSNICVAGIHEVKSGTSVLLSATKADLSSHCSQTYTCDNANSDS